MNSNFEIGKVIVHGVDGTSVYRNIDEALTHLSGKVTEAFKKPISLFPAEYANYEVRLLAAYPELRERLKSARKDQYPYEDKVTDPYTYGDPLEPLTRMSEDMKSYDDAGTNGSSSHRDPTPNSSASISVEMVGDKWFTNDLLRVLEATVMDTIREYKESNQGARSIQISISTGTQSTQ